MSSEGGQPAGEGPGNTPCEGQAREVAIISSEKAAPRWDGGRRLQIPKKQKLSRGRKIEFHRGGSRAGLGVKGQGDMFQEGKGKQGLYDAAAWLPEKEQAPRCLRYASAGWMNARQGSPCSKL